MRILVTGDRNWRNSRVMYEALKEVLDEFWEAPGGHTIVHGDARGADIMAETICTLFWCNPEDMEPHPALWREEGPGAGPRRNQRMLDTGIDYVVGFHNDIENSRGTKDMLKRCARAGVPGRLFSEEGEVPDWQQLVNPPR